MAHVYGMASDPRGGIMTDSAVSQHAEIIRRIDALGALLEGFVKSRGVDAPEISADEISVLRRDNETMQAALIEIESMAYQRMEPLVAVKPLSDLATNALSACMAVWASQPDPWP
jgi:hypothetical protein